MKRRTFIVQAGAALAGAALASVAPEWAVSEADVKLEIAPLELEIAPERWFTPWPTMATFQGR